ncbi:MAG: hypothetical protein RL757_2420 [Bacteroidota bacterium]|jgi:hypothetical protein
MRLLGALVVLFFAPPSINRLFAQKFEAGLFFGGANYLGDLADQQIEISQTRIGIGGVIRYNVSPYFSVKANLYNGTIKGNDLSAKDPNLRARGYSFSGSLQEIAVNAEFNFLGRTGYKRDFFHRFFNPYISVGIGLATCSAKPVAPAGTVPYPFPEENDVDNFLAIPITIGAKFHLSEYVALNLEFGQRSIFSDYLDGVSKKGNPNKDDWYVFGGVALIFTIPDGEY